MQNIQICMFIRPLQHQITKYTFQYKCFTDCKVWNQTIDVLFKMKTKYCDLLWLLSFVCRCHLILYTAYVMKFRHFLALQNCSNTFCDHSVPKIQSASNPSCFFFILFFPQLLLKRSGWISLLVQSGLCWLNTVVLVKWRDLEEL